MIPQEVEPTEGMNSLERRYADHLYMLKLGGEIIDYRFEAISFRLAKKTFYHPDFVVIKEDGFELHECKGFWRDDARVKIKVAAKLFPWMKFIAVTFDKKGWKFEDF